MTSKDRTIRKATATDLPVIMQLIESGRRIMISSGNPHQWDSNHPSAEQLERDVARGESYLLLDHGQPIATWAFIPGPDASYASIRGGAWFDDDEPYSVIHRVASLPQAHGVMTDILDYCFSRCRNIRIDTHRDNKIMQHCLLRAGFHYCGIIQLKDGGGERLAYQRIVGEDTKA
jgi:RimJ/RimL family protein N-acetyltransferase